MVYNMDVANPTVRDRVVQVNIEEVVQGGTTPTSHMIVRNVAIAALAKRSCR
jgi:hypothetical protein